MKKIPYGISNFKRLIKGNMYYVDKTKYIEILEQKEDFQFFIRPRRFGKSLFLSLLDTYYDLNEKDNFDKYFSGLYIYNNKTSDANSFMVLKLNFATIITDQGKDTLIESFDELVCSAVNKCILKYSHILEQDQLPAGKNKATYAFDYLISLAEIKEQKIMLLIDEYDNFANNIMSEQRDLYNDLQGDLLKDSQEKIFEINNELIDVKKQEARKQLNNYSKEKNMLKSTEKEIRKLIVITLGKKYVDYELIL